MGENQAVPIVFRLIDRRNSQGAMGRIRRSSIFAAKFHPTIEQTVEISPVDEPKNHASFYNKIARVLTDLGLIRWCRARTTHSLESYNDGLLTPAAADKSPPNYSPVAVRSPAFSRLPVDRVLFDVGVHGAAYGRIEVCGAEAIE